jgi:archaellum component FlaC
MNKQNMWMQQSSRYAAIIRINLLSQIHQLHSAIEGVGLLQNHPLDKLAKHVDFMSNHSDKIGRMVDGLHDHIKEQDVKMDQLATKVNDLVSVVESQKEL